MGKIEDGTQRIGNGLVVGKLLPFSEVKACTRSAIGFRSCTIALVTQSAVLPSTSWTKASGDFRSVSETMACL